MTGTPRRVLIVDDSRAVRWAARGILEQLGLTVEEAENGQAALELFQRGSTYDAVLLDIDMPVMDGLEFLRAFRADQRFDQIVVMMCTTANTLRTIEGALDSGANEYIMKPFTSEILKAKLGQVGIA